MVSTKKPQPPNDLIVFLESVLAEYRLAGRRLVLALSGGQDSVALLDLLCHVRRDLLFELSALHVNHGISPHASAWADFCHRLCLEANVSLKVVEVTVRREPGSSLEAQARQVRYEALGGCNADFVLTAHQQDDQAETLMLQLLRGAGVKGLSGMAGEGALPFSHTFRPRLLRPLLGVPREKLAQYCIEQGLEWVEDESNDCLQPDRNYLRHEILPRMKARFPGCLDTLGRSAAHQAEAEILLQDLALQDAQLAVVQGRLQVAALAGHSAPRARNLLRHYLSGLGLPLPSERRLSVMLNQLISARADTCLRITHAGVEIRRFSGEVHVVTQSVSAASQAVVWQRESVLAWHGIKVQFRQEMGQGISLEKMGRQPIWLRSRLGGERLKLAENRPSRSLKNLFQEAGLPPWERERLPLVYIGESLVCVPGLGVDWGCRALAGEMGIVIEIGH